MTRPLEARIAAVGEWLECARIVRARFQANPSTLVSATGLSPAGVQLALAEHLEVDAPPSEVRELVESSPEVDRVAVILSANVFVGALRAIALAAASAPEVVVRPSSRESVFATALVEEAIARGVTGVSLDTDLDPAAVETGEIHVYGRDETIADIRRRARVPVRGHGAGFGIAVVSTPCRAAAALVARDVVPFDQRGCLSPRVVVVVGTMDAARTFAAALDCELADWETKVPRGVVSVDDRASVTRYEAAVTFAGELFRGPAHAVGVAPTFTLPPAARCVHVCCVDDAASVPSVLATHVRFVTCIGHDFAVFPLTAPAARIVPLGCMQRPAFDGPVDRRESPRAH